MTDWFETHFRDAVEPATIDPDYAARMRDLVIEKWSADSRMPSVATQAAAASERDPDVTTDDLQGETIVLEIQDTSDEDESVSILREPRHWWLAAAATAASVAIVAGLVLAPDREDFDPVDSANPATDTTAPGPTTVEDPTAPRDVLALWSEDFEFVPLGRGVYSVDPDGEAATPLQVTFEVEDDGWEAWTGAFKRSDSGHIGLSITTIDNVVRDGCQDHTVVDPPVGPTVDDLVTALTDLAPFEVTKPPSDVTMFGYPGKHLQWTVPDLPFVGTGDDRVFSRCRGQKLASWVAPNLGDTAFYGYNGEPGRTEDFWILDVEGTRLVIITTSSPAAPNDDVREMDDIFESIEIEV